MVLFSELHACDLFYSPTFEGPVNMMLSICMPSNSSATVSMVSSPALEDYNDNIKFKSLLFLYNHDSRVAIVNDMPNKMICAHILEIFCCISISATCTLI